MERCLTTVPLLLLLIKGFDFKKCLFVLRLFFCRHRVLLLPSFFIFNSSVFSFPFFAFLCACNEKTGDRFVHSRLDIFCRRRTLGTRPPPFFLFSFSLSSFVLLLQHKKDNEEAQTTSVSGRKTLREEEEEEAFDHHPAKDFFRNEEKSRVATPESRRQRRRPSSYHLSSRNCGRLNESNPSRWYAVRGARWYRKNGSRRACRT